VPLDGKLVLEKLAAMPVYQWQPKGANAGIVHYGPMAQDFYQAFALGDSDKMIGMQDIEGVALAAIQGLRQLVREKDARIDAQQQKIVDLENRIEQVELLRGELAAMRSALLAVSTDMGRVAAR